ncbi:DUF4328 domain-containing protein [Tsukamurella sp. 8F]|uniref:DUF4328 domain-containing protein n=1 Tax=unclassified Tsukamurella TaxID=2633480 RepID=UPI0023B97DCD|nr:MULTISPECIES: DUF4328 domain-containing protein [unclassified Tsukamurella]MDF0529728.1 DUF4328 domain-containing protein [Tsukamurella sp. 8J]MDF0586013.1 DUF4328 domain-containing protein [Tsukamurella sp. 8F]
MITFRNDRVDAIVSTPHASHKASLREHERPVAGVENRPARRIRPLAGAIMALTTLVVSLQVGLAGAQWWTYSNLKAHNGAAPAVRTFKRWWIANATLTVLIYVTMLAVAVVLVVWLRRARKRSDELCRASQKLTPGWVIAGWFCPVVNLWFPAVAVGDVLRASDPRTPLDAASLRGRPGMKLVVLWWVSWLAAVVMMQVVRVHNLDHAEYLMVTQNEGFSFGGFLSTARLQTVVATVFVVAGGALIAIIMRIERYQQCAAAPAAALAVAADQRVLAAPSGRGWIGPLVVGAVLLAGIVVVAAIGLVVRREPPPTPTNAIAHSSASTTDRAGPTEQVWQHELLERAEQSFPGLVPSSGEGAGYWGTTCTEDRTAEPVVNCRNESQNLSVFVGCQSDPRQAQVGVGHPAQTWRRPSGSGRITFEVEGDVEITFDQAPRNACSVNVMWVGHSTQDILTRWWPSAPV